MKKNTRKLYLMPIILALLLVYCTVYVGAAGETGGKNKVISDASGISQIKVHALHGFVKIQPADVERHSFEYDKSLYAIKGELADGTLHITVDVLNDIKNYKGKQFYLYLPQADYEKVILTVDDPAMVELSNINADLEIVSDGGWVDVRIPIGFDRNLKLEGKESYTNVVLPKTDGDYSLNLKKNSSGYVSLPFQDYKVFANQYAVKNGTGEKSYSFNLDGGYLYVSFETVKSK